jgi:hypothetical protein
MNPIFKIISSLIIGINRWIDSLSLQTVETIRRAFFFLMFIMFFVAIAIGYNMGKDSARIKSPPIAEFVNDSFKIKVSREKGGDFSGMIESEILKESGINSLNRYEFPVRIDDTPEIGRSIIEPESILPEIDTRPDIIKNDKPYESDTMGADFSESRNVDPLERKVNENPGSEIIINNNPDSKFIDNSEKTRDVKPLSGTQGEMPEVIKDDSGIIMSE